MTIYADNAATTKMSPAAIEAMTPYFDGIYGATHDRSRTDKACVIAYAIEEFGLTDRSKAVMVGDREYDIIGAKENGLSAIGVSYGYRQNPHEFEKADAVADTVAELKAILL